jgi:Raf kinase inhibitor-like YbhB/YbcL family protein
MRRVPVLFAAFAVLIASGCGSSSRPTTTSTSVRAAIAVTSGGFQPGAPIPRVYTCDGRDVSPALRAVGLPAAAKEVVVVMRDPDAPGGDFIHWGVAGVKPAHGSITLPVAATPPGAVMGRNSFGSLGYRGPCPPSGPAHHYVITVYALGQPSGLKHGFTAGDVSALPILAQGTLTGTYTRPK